MLRVVIPVAAVATGGKGGGPIPTIAKASPIAYAAAWELRRTVAANVRVAIEIVMMVDVDVIATPARATTPTTAPECAHHDPNAERQEQAACVVTGRRIVNRWIGVNRRAVHNNRIVGRDVYHLGIGLFDDD